MGRETRCTTYNGSPKQSKEGDLRRGGVSHPSLSGMASAPPLRLFRSLHGLPEQTKIRESYIRSVRNLSPTIPSHHISHCFDTLRQHIQCTASDNLLYTYGKHSSGDGQFRQCRNWNYLHQWTVAHSTCDPITHKSEPILSHYNLCSDDTDGLPKNINDELD